MKLFHFQAYGFPKAITFAPLFGFKYSEHAYRESQQDGNCRIEKLPQNFIPRTDRVIEIETDDAGNLIKILFRKHYNVEFDLVIALMVETKMVKTVWVNSKRDTHRTLDRSRYDRP